MAKHQGRAMGFVSVSPVSLGSPAVGSGVAEGTLCPERVSTSALSCSSHGQFVQAYKPYVSPALRGTRFPTRMLASQGPSIRAEEVSDNSNGTASPRENFVSSPDSGPRDISNHDIGDDEYLPYFLEEDDAASTAKFASENDDDFFFDEDDNFDMRPDAREDQFLDEQPVRSQARSREPDSDTVPRDESIFGPGSFSALGLSPVICKALEESQIVQPTRIQTRTIPTILGGVDVVMGAATGSGKTFAYLLPIIESLKAAEALREDGDPPIRIARRPRAIVIVPTRELLEQVHAVAKSLAYRVKFRVVCTSTGTGSAGFRKLQERLNQSPCDVLVGTTGRLLQLIEMRAIDLRFVRHVVVDEVDTMFDTGFGPELQKILQYTRGGSKAENKPQYIAAGATHPKAAESMYSIEFPLAKRIDVDLHCAPPGLTSRFVRTNSNSKIPELISLLGESQKDGLLRGGRLIVFCNTISSARFVDHYLAESGYRTSCVHGEVPAERRATEFKAFKDMATQIMVCTDIAARGLDNLEIAHVVMFDFPTSAVDYIHRAGRTARAGAKGRVTSLVLKKDATLASAMERASKAKSDALVSARLARENEAAEKRRVRAQSRAAERPELVGVGARERGAGYRQARGDPAEMRSDKNMRNPGRTRRAGSNYNDNSGQRDADRRDTASRDSPSRSRNSARSYASARPGLRPGRGPGGRSGRHGPARSSSKRNGR